MSDTAILVIALVIIAFVPGDLYAALRLIIAAAKPPPIPALTLYAGLSTGVAVSSVASGILALSTIVRVTTGDSLLPAGVGLTLLLVCITVISLPNVFLLRQLRRWDRER